MISAVLDTNVLVQAVISSPRSASRRTLRAYRDKKYRLVFSTETLDELHDVLILPQMQARHGWTDVELAEHFTFLLANSLFYRVSHTVSPRITRDVTDPKFLELAHVADADYLVTNDRRHLLRLRQHGCTKIITPAQFLAVLAETS
jgi:putative PIN family toxin of toxin-antitoxin system